MEEYYYKQEKNVKKRKGEIRSLFDTIAPGYDRLNRTLSLGVDFLWRKKVVRLVEKARKNFSNDEGVVGDLCCGTGDLSRLLRKKGNNVVSIDFSPGMLSVGKERGWLDERTAAGDVSALPVKDAAFSCATIAFGIRNLPDIETFLTEAFRSLQDGGSLFVLELTRPKGKMISFFYGMYLTKIVSFFGGLLTGKWDAYRYLAGTVKTFLSPEEIRDIAKGAGFSRVEIKPLSFGIAAILECRKANQ